MFEDKTISNAISCSRYLLNRDMIRVSSLCVFVLVVLARRSCPVIVGVRRSNFVMWTLFSLCFFPLRREPLRRAIVSFYNSWTVAARIFSLVLWDQFKLILVDAYDMNNSRTSLCPFAFVSMFAATCDFRGIWGTRGEQYPSRVVQSTWIALCFDFLDTACYGILRLVLTQS